MKLLIFDLDLTLVDTTNCHDYLKTAAGREAIVDLLDSGEVKTALYFKKTVTFFNSLIDRFADGETDTLPIIVSDSPKAYCEKVLDVHGFNIPTSMVFGGVGKPCVALDKIVDVIQEFDIEKYVDSTEITDCLIIGDSPKDVHFGHVHSIPSVWAKWGYVPAEYRFSFDECKPTRTVELLSELRDVIDEFIADGEAAFNYKKPDFAKINKMHTVDIDNFTEHTVQDIGYVRRYVPEAFEFDNPDYRDAFFEVHWMLKRAKDVPKSIIRQNRATYFLKKDGEFMEAKRLKSRAGAYKHDFVTWLESKGIKGKVLLVPVPSSVPAECNRTYTVDEIAKWWAEWTDHKDIKLIHDQYLFVERFAPKIPTHAQAGQRYIEDQLTTLGFYPSMFKSIPDDLAAVVFLDDVVTSGNSINAMATIFRELGAVPRTLPLYGYVWFKTYHPDFDDNDEELFVMADTVAGEN
ncbi:hypothetical protein ACX07_05995 [Vibrio parahaemolyticus]|uniref:HAD family hydrolase n=1 Tax=Vibrio harveyi group TaxID=717610 RepID=UPI0006A722A5|nr:HAD family hydrolase [Vibrio parahaemolyticus]EKB1970462.1 HAD family hydrolase [Vibrio parahaemolyticus]KOF50706.1 hypothetical protein ACX07_05995 [Vibrio parahaemolyticus]MCS0006332.1 HAD family hydrolase [Vibrio parahaemolyticus]MCS0041649.1 HAD family hydrolase [Vibrio parahaemolyticus]